DDAGLDHGARAIHAGHDLDINSAAFGGRTSAGRVADGITLGMLDPQILGRPLHALRHIVSDAARKGIVAGGADFAVRPDNHAADLRVYVLAALRHHLADVQVIFVPTRDLSHRPYHTIRRRERRYATVHRHRSDR